MRYVGGNYIGDNPYAQNLLPPQVVVNMLGSIGVSVDLRTQYIGPDWEDSAACADMPDPFVYKEGTPQAVYEQLTESARKVCEDCSVLVSCFRTEFAARGQGRSRLMRGATTPRQMRNFRTQYTNG